MHCSSVKNTVEWVNAVGYLHPIDEKRLICETVIEQLNIEKGTIVNMELDSHFVLIATRAESSGTVLNGVYFMMPGSPLWAVPELLFESS